MPGELELAVVLRLRVGHFGFSRSQIGLGLIDLRLELHLLDLIEQIAGLDVLAFPERDLLQKALDARPHIDLLDGLDPPEELEGLADALHRGRPHADRRVGLRCGGLLLFVATRNERQDEADSRQETHAEAGFLHHATPHLYRDAAKVHAGLLA